MNEEQPTNEAEAKKSGNLAASIERMTACLEDVYANAKAALDLMPLMPRDGMKWMTLSKAVFDIHERTRLGWQKLVDPPPTIHDPAAGTGAFFTPPAAFEAIMQNPPFDIPPTPEPIQPGTPKMVPGEERPMSRPEAAYILAKLATSRRVNAGGVIALQMGARAILKRHFDRQRNWAKRRALRSAAPHPAPLTPEEELADTIKRQKEAE